MHTNFVWIGIFFNLAKGTSLHRRASLKEALLTSNFLSVRQLDTRDVRLQTIDSIADQLG